MTTLTNRIPGMPPSFGASFGFVNAPLGRVADELFEWQGELGLGPSRHDLPGGLVDNAHLVLPLARAPVCRDLLVGTVGDRWTAYFDASPGGDPSGPTSVLGRRLGVASVTVTAVPFQKEPGALTEVFGGLIFAYSADSSLQSERSVALVEGESSSSRYHFEAFGPVQPWEEPERYTARRKRDRITPELIARYCRALGIDVFDLDFYAGPSVFVERTNFDLWQPTPEVLRAHAVPGPPAPDLAKRRLTSDSEAAPRPTNGARRVGL
jgi:hypothetical protein